MKGASVALKRLMEGLIDAEQIPELAVTGIAYDSRQVQAGNLFAAITGGKHDGHDFIPEAISRGATVVMGTHPFDSLSIPYLQVKDLRATLATIAARFYDEPTRKIPILGVTGTNGKTTCCYLMESILKAAGYHPAVFGTINYRYCGKVYSAPHTTPEAPDLQCWISQAMTAGADAAVMEISSHGLMMDRVRECHLDGAIFTNLSQDHLDFHGDMESYYFSKRKLFSEVLPVSAKTKKGAFINYQDPYGRRLIDEISIPTMRCGWESGLEYRVAEEDYSIEGIHATIETPEGPLSITSSLLGPPNLQNILLSIAACQSLDIPSEAICQGICALRGVPGRLERVVHNKGVSIFVDYAHTPEALRAVLTTLRPYVKHRLITLFGCGGDRDPGKRPLMGNVVAKMSDIVVITSDNPRTEDPEKIIDEILPGVCAERFPNYQKREKRGYWIEIDRRKAIQQAIALTEPGDIVLIAGKGHEDYQILGTKKISFDDREEVKAAYEAHP